MSHSTGTARLTTSSGPRRNRPTVRLAVLGATATVMVWTGHDVTWDLLGRAGGLWLLDRAAALIVLAALALVALLRAVTDHWLVAAVAVGLLVALLR